MGHVRGPRVQSGCHMTHDGNLKTLQIPAPRWTEDCREWTLREINSKNSGKESLQTVHSPEKYLKAEE